MADGKIEREKPLLMLLLAVVGRSRMCLVKRIFHIGTNKRQQPRMVVTMARDDNKDDDDDDDDDLWW